MDPSSTTYKVHQCSKCSGGTEYYCESCPCDLCSQCKENHVKDLKTIDHNLVSHHEKFNNIPKQEICVRHRSHVYKKYCEPCEVPICFHCRKHRTHRQLDVRTAYKTKRQQHRGTIHTIRSDDLFYRPLLLLGITDDIKKCQTKFSRYRSEVLTKAQTLRDLINKVRTDFMKNVFCDFDFKHRCLKQMIEMGRHIVSVQEYEHRYVQPAFIFSALQFLSSIKTALPQIHLTLHTSQLSMIESFNREDVMESLSIQITKRRHRRLGNQCLLKLTSVPDLHQSLTVTGVDSCYHISSVTSDRVWVSDRYNLILTDTTGAPLHRVEDPSCGNILTGNGSHTVNSESELIYIDRKYNINQLSKDMKTTKTLKMKKMFCIWKSRCVYWSPSTGDLLVGMFRKKLRTGKVTRYNQSGQLTQTIQHDNTGQGLYSLPFYITENNNGDVVVSASGAVVVTERGGRHRFSYTGHPSGSGLWPLGICTDALSHILVCDGTTKTVQMLNKDGQFLSHLLIRPSGIFLPQSLSYDVNTHRLWVGSWDNNTVVIYRYITRQDALTDTAVKLHTSQLSMTESLNKEDVMESLSAIQITERGNRRVGNQCLMKLTSGAEFHQSLTLTGVYRCVHISCVTSDRVWVSDWNNLMLTDTTGVPLHRLKDSCSYLFGLHTVNSESELIYVDRKYNIKKQSKDMKTTKTLIMKKIFSKWRPLCVYWSPSTGDLLVGMYREKPWTGKVTRYNRSGQLTQTIQHDITGLGLYRQPLYITENNNGDVVVSDTYSGAVVVTQRGGRHRFSYTGHPPGSVLQPCGICTDALSHILVCDRWTNTVQMIDEDGQFLSHPLTKSQEMGEPYSLSYDVNTHRLWVGSGGNKVCVYSYIDTQDALTDEDTHSTDKDTHSRDEDTHSRDEDTHSRDEDVFSSSTPAV